ncbi:MAG: rhomboid family intramembrane serine protease [Ferruginibacter sp.]
MGELDRYGEYKNPKSRFSLGQDGNALTALFALNVIFFLILLVLQVAFFFYQQPENLYNEKIVQWFALPSSLTQLSERPWTLLTYVFSDTGNNVFRILTNMIWLWAFGYILQQMSGNDKIIPIYIYGGVVGGIIFIAAHYLIPPLQPNIGISSLLGANTGTIAIAMATTALAPNHRFFTMIRGGIPIWVLMAVYIFIDLAGIAGMGAAYSLAHLGGALAGFMFIILMKNGKDGSIWMNRFYSWLMNLFNPNKKNVQTSAKEKVFYETGGRKPFKKTAIITQQRVDEILDKITQKGYNFLTEEEKTILRKAAEDDNLSS